MRTVQPALAAAAIACVSSIALAQPAPPLPAKPAPQPAPAAAPAAQPAAAQPGAARPAAPQDPKAAAAQPVPPPTDEPAKPPKPPTIEVDDPLLAPIPAAPKTITGFREVLTLISNQSTALRIAKAEIDRAKGQRRVTLAGVMPTLSANAQLNGQAVQNTNTTYRGLSQCALDPTYNVATFADLRTCAVTPTGTITTPGDPIITGALSISQRLDARSYYAIGTADQNIKSTELRSEDARRTAIVAAANAIVNVVSNERISEISRVGLRASLERLELTKRRKRLGSGTDLDIVRAEQDAASARSTIITGDETLRKARESLGQIFNSTDAYGVPQSFSLNDIEQALKTSCHIDKPENRVDVLAAKSDLAVAERSVTDAKLMYAPTAQISSSLLISSASSAGASQGAGLFSSSNISWSINAVLTIPLWDGGNRYGQAKVAAAQVEQAKVRVEQATTTASLEATQAQRAVTVAEQARQNSEKARDLAKETARLSQLAFESGAGTSLDLIDSGRLLRQAELDLAVKELEVVRSKIAALLALSACDV